MDNQIRKEYKKERNVRKKIHAIINENGMSLAGKWKSGIFSLLFSRFTIMLILFSIQVLFLLLVWEIFGELLSKISTYGQTAFSMIVLVYLLNTDMDTSGKITWMLVIAVFPVFGSMFYFWTKLELGHRRTQKRLDEVIKESRGNLVQDTEVSKRLMETDRDSASIANYTMLAGNFPAYDNSRVTYYPDGEKKLQALTAELKKAKKFIFMEYFIIQEGYMWGKVLEILADKVKEGVEVRFMFDGMCQFSKVPMDYKERLKAVGIDAMIWAPIVPVVTTSYNYRDHRKIAVIDGRVAFTGGVNLADEYINRGSKFGYWKDAAVKVEGDAVMSFTYMFLTMWYAASGIRQDFEAYMEETLLQSGLPDAKLQEGKHPDGKHPDRKLPDSKGFVIPYGDSPLDRYKVGEMVYMDILNTAENYVYIMTPYLILDGELETALRFAAERGVDVRIILPGIPDKKLVYALAKNQCRSLLESGVRIYFFTPGFVHAKVFVSDDRKAVVGTINLDYRSLYHHFENAVYMVDQPCVADIKADFQRTCSECSRVTTETLKKDHLFTKLTGFFAKMIAPML